MAISEFKKIGLKQLILSSEANQVVSARAKKLDIPCIQNISNKSIGLTNYCKENKIELKNVVFIGNDINDLGVMKLVGFKFCPSDARLEIKKISDKVLNSAGGYGVVRELFDIFVSQSNE